MSSARIPEASYLSRDYATIRADLMSIIKLVFPNWEATDDMDFGVMLLELQSYISDIGNFYGDRWLNETFLPTAKLRQSVISRLKLINYELTPPTAAATTLNVTTSDHEVDIFIAKRQQASTGAGLIFETVEDLLIPAGTNNIVVEAQHGQTIANELIGTSNGEINQEFTLQYTPYIFNSEIIKVDAIKWTRVANFLFSTPTDKHYKIILDEDGNATIIFGNGNNGLIPAPGVTITATEYRIGGGAIGNIPANAIKSFSPSVAGVLSVTNLEPGSGGSDAETLEEAKVNGPDSLQALERAVILDDFRTLSQGYSVPNAGTVAKAKAVVFNWYITRVYIAPKADVATLPTNLLKDSLQQYLLNKSMATQLVEVHDPTYIKGKVTAILNIIKNYDLDDRYREGLLAIQKAFAYKNQGFGVDAKLSDVYEALTFEGISSVDISEFCLETEEGIISNRITIEDFEIFDLPNININLTVRRAVDE